MPRQQQEEDAPNDACSREEPASGRSATQNFTNHDVFWGQEWGVHALQDDNTLDAIMHRIQHVLGNLRTQMQQRGSSGSGDKSTVLGIALEKGTRKVVSVLPRSPASRPVHGNAVTPGDLLLQVNGHPYEPGASHSQKDGDGSRSWGFSPQNRSSSTKPLGEYRLSVDKIVSDCDTENLVLVVRRGGSGSEEQVVCNLHRTELQAAMDELGNALEDGRSSKIAQEKFLDTIQRASQQLLTVAEMTEANAMRALSEGVDVVSGICRKDLSDIRGRLCRLEKLESACAACKERTLVHLAARRRGAAVRRAFDALRVDWLRESLSCISAWRAAHAFMATRTLVGRVFGTWSEALREAAGQAMHMQRMVSRAESRCARLARKLVLSSLRAWQRDAAGRKTKRRMHARLTRMRARAVCRKMLTMWCNASYARGAVRARASAILVAAQKGLMASAIGGWYNTTQRSRRHAVVVPRFSMQRANKAAMQCLGLWRHWAARQTLVSQTYAQIAVHRGRESLAVVFKAWVGVSLQSKGWLAWWRHRVQRQRQRCLLRGWRRLADGWARERKGDAHFSATKSSSISARVMHDWRAFVAGCHVVRAHGGAMQQRTEQRRRHEALLQCLSSWRLKVQWAQIEVKVVRGCEGRLRAQALATWRALAAGLARRRRLCGKGVWRRREAVEAACLWLWHTHVITVRNSKTRGTEVVARWAHLQCSAAFQCWKHLSSTVRRARAVARKILSRQVCATFWTWRAEVQAAARRKGVATRILARMAKGLLSATFIRWSDHASARALQRSNLQRVLHRLTWQNVAAAFGAWTGSVAARGRVERLVQRVKCMRERVAWATWAVVCADERAGRRADARFAAACCRSLMCKSLLDWAGLARVRGARRARGDATVRRRTRRRACEAALRGWAERMRALEHQRASHETVVGRRHRVTIAAGFRGWHECAAGERALALQEVGIVQQRAWERLAGWFHAWLTTTKKKRALTWRGRKAVRRRKQFVLLGALDSWGMSAVHSRRNETAIGRMDKHRQGLRVVHAWRLWLRVLCRTRRGQRADARLCRRLWQDSVTKWRRVVARQRAAEGCVSKAVARRGHRRVSRVLWAWGWVSVSERRKRQGLTRIAQRVLSRRAACAMDALQRNSHTARRHRAWRSYSHSQVRARALQRWHSHVQSARRHTRFQTRVAPILLRVSRSVLAPAVAAWRSGWVDTVRACAAAVSVRQQHDAFDAWLAWLQFSARRRALGWRVVYGWVRRALDRWRWCLLTCAEEREQADERLQQSLLRRSLCNLRLMAAFSKRVAHIEVLVSAHMTQHRCQRYLRHLVFTTWLHVKRQQKFAARLWLGALSRAQSSFCRRALLNFEVGCLMSRCTSISQLDQSGWSLPEAALQVKGPRPVDAVKDACSPAGRARYPGMHDRAGNCSRR